MVPPGGIRVSRDHRTRTALTSKKQPALEEGGKPVTPLNTYCATPLGKSASLPQTAIPLPREQEPRELRATHPD